jgi:hypothetical protein
MPSLLDATEFVCDLLLFGLPLKWLLVILLLAALVVVLIVLL